jgi:hypothetical protein
MEQIVKTQAALRAQWDRQLRDIRAAVRSVGGMLANLIDQDTIKFDKIASIRYEMPDQGRSDMSWLRVCFGLRSADPARIVPDGKTMEALAKCELRRYMCAQGLVYCHHGPGPRGARFVRLELVNYREGAMWCFLEICRRPRDWNPEWGIGED